MIYLCKQKQGHKGGPGATGPAAGRAGVLTYRRRSPYGRGLKPAGSRQGTGARVPPETNRQNAKSVILLNFFSPPSGNQAGTAGPRPAEGLQYYQKIS